MSRPRMEIDAQKLRDLAPLGLHLAQYCRAMGGVHRQTLVSALKREGLYRGWAVRRNTKCQ